MELFDIALSAPVLPATVILCVMLCWAIMVILGAIDFNHVIHLPDHGDIDLPVDPGGAVPDAVTPEVASPDLAGPDIAGHATDGAGGALHGGLTAGKVGLSVLALRWLNLGSVPIIVWLCLFSLFWWTISALSWSLVDTNFFQDPNLFWATLLIGRNLILGLIATKVVTHPFRTRFNFTTPSTVPQNLIGRECVISSTEATPDFGLVKFPTGGAPLLLNVRTDGVHLPRGTPVWITHYDSTRRVYIVSPTTTKNLLS